MIKHDHHGLHRDLQRMAQLRSRRRFLRAFVGTGLVVPWLGCDAKEPSASGSDGGGRTMDDDTRLTDCALIPVETAGPYPGDGSNGPNVLTLEGVVRSDIRASFGDLSGTAAGVPLTFTLTLVDSSADCAPLAEHAIYAWHCTQDGKYSLYTAADQNYLRGVQVTDGDGRATFSSIFPGCYSGRWPHIHFEIFASVASAVEGSAALRTSQLALPAGACNEVYGTSGYAASVGNFASISLASDNVFRDGADSQLAEVEGDAEAGYSATLAVGIAGS